MSDCFRKLFSIALPFVGAIPSSYITKGEITTWYKCLKKPCFTPPNYMFGPVWTALYATMGYSSYLVWRHGGGFNGDTYLPLALYGSQLLLNWSWTMVFFGRHKIGWAAVNCVLLWANVLGCIITFRHVDTRASNLMLPYLAWVSLASALNISIWKLNKHDPSLSE